MSIQAFAGLPGSGKSRRIRELQDQGYMTRDDMNTNWDASMGLVKGWLGQGKNVVVSDVEFVKDEWRDKLNGALPGVHIQWEFFENAPHKCIRGCHTTTVKGIEDR